MLPIPPLHPATQAATAEEAIAAGAIDEALKADPPQYNFYGHGPLSRKWTL